MQDYCWFQWLPGRPPQAIGELFENGRLDLSYEVDTQPGEKKEFKKHRALKIMRPTTELTGTYRCKVSSFVDEDFMQKKMIIYCKLHTSLIEGAIPIGEKNTTFFWPPIEKAHE